MLVDFLFFPVVSVFFLLSNYILNRRTRFSSLSHDDYMDGRQQPPADQLETMRENIDTVVSNKVILL